MNIVYFGDNLDVLKTIPDESIDLVYIDPPFNTGKVQSHQQISTVRDDKGGDSTGFAGRKYKTTVLGINSFHDSFSDYLNFLEPRILEAYRVLKKNGSFYFHIDYREVHYCKILIDTIFGRQNFLNEIIWAYDYGARSKSRWPAKHDNILFYAKDAKNYVFNYDAIDRIPYMAPGLVGPDKAAKGKTPTDVWWHTIVPTNGKERMGYPTQKPVGIIKRLIAVSSPANGIILDFFAGSGTTGAAALECGRKFVLIDSNQEAITVMQRRFVDRTDVEFRGTKKMKMSKTTLKIIIKECLVEILAEGLGPAAGTKLTEAIRSNGTTIVGNNSLSSKHIPTQKQNMRPSPPLQQGVKIISALAPHMADIFADTANTVMKQNAAGHGKSQVGDPGARPMGLYESVMAEHDPIDVFGEETANNWATLAFASQKHGEKS